MIPRRRLDAGESGPSGSLWRGKAACRLAGLLLPYLLASILPGAFAGMLTPVLELYRPASSAAVKFKTVLAEGENRIPYAGATVLVSLSGGAIWFAKTDLLGRGDIPVSEIIARAGEKSETITLSVSVALNETVDEKRLVFSRSELLLLSRSAAEKKVSEGNVLAKAGRIEEALLRYRQAVRIAPDFPKAAYNEALACEKLGRRRVAISAYSEYLLRFPSEVSDREAVKGKILLLARGLDPPPPVPSELHGLLGQAGAAALGGNPFEALRLYEIVQSAAPWWAEGYYGAGTVFFHLAVQNSFAYAVGAVRNFENFLAAARPEDARVETVRAKVREIRKIKEGIDAPKTVSVH